MSIDNDVTLRLCQCCRLLIANGECCADDECGTAERLANRWPGAEWHLGVGAGTGKCGHDLDDSEQEEAHYEGCEDLGFSWSWCDGCDSHLGGQRHAGFASPRTFKSAM